MTIPLKVREEVRFRSGNLCEICRGIGDFRGLQMCHLKNKGMGGTKKVETAEDLLHLCAYCHNVVLHHLKESGEYGKTQKPLPRGP